MKQLIGTMVILNLIIVMFVTGVISVGAQGGEPDAGVPTSMNYQGYLTDDTGEPVAGPVDITFTIYTTGGVPVWAEKHFGIEPSNGLFSVELGDHGSPMAAAVFDGNMELGIKVNNDTEMNPRQKIASMGYALRCEEANNANTLDGMDSFDFVAAGGDTMSGALNISSNLDVTGNTSLGNASTDSLTVAARVNSDLIPLIDNSYDLGYFTRYWQDLYVDDAYTNRLFTEGYAYISGTLNLADDDGDNDTILFDHKSDYKHLQWNEANDRFEFNSDLNVSGTVSATSFVGDGTGLTGVDSLWNESSSDIYYNSGNVGIGITIPNSLLHVEGNSSNPTIKGVNSGNGQGLYGITYGSGAAVQGMSNGAGAGGYFTSASGYGLIVANGNVGIGTTSPTSLLEVDGVITAAHGDSDNWNAAYGWGDHDTAGYLQSETDPVFGSSAASGISGTDISEWDTAYGWGNHATAGYDDTNDSWTGTGSTSTTSGNVGIGINSPETMLHIYHGAGGGSNPDTTYDPLAIESANNAYVNLITPSSNLGGLVFSDNVRARGLIGYDHTDDHMQFRTNGSIRMKINSSGDIGIGTTSPGNRLDINTTNTDKGIAFNGEDALTGYNGNEWLYLNPNQDYTGGVYTPANFVAYGNLGVGDSSPVAQFVVGSDAGVDYVAGAGDAYVQNDLEVDGTIYGDLTGSVDLNYTPGSILFTGSGGVISQNNSALYWDNTNNRLGINNSSPVDDLHVKGTGVLRGYLKAPLRMVGFRLFPAPGRTMAYIHSMMGDLPYMTGPTYDIL